MEGAEDKGVKGLELLFYLKGWTNGMVSALLEKQNCKLEKTRPHAFFSYAQNNKSTKFYAMGTGPLAKG